MEKQTKAPNNTAVIYARVSSTGDRQCTDRQVTDLTNYAAKNGLTLVHDAFTEHVSGAKRNDERLGLCACLDYCEANNVGTLLISELSRLGRNVGQVLANVQRCLDNGLNIYFQKEGLSLFMADGKPNPFVHIMASVLGTCAQLEREAIQFRLNSGYRQYLANGGEVGRKEGSAETADRILEKYPEVTRQLQKAQRAKEAGKKPKSLRDIAKLCDVALNTVQRVKRAMADSTGDNDQQDV